MANDPFLLGRGWRYWLRIAVLGAAMGLGVGYWTDLSEPKASERPF